MARVLFIFILTAFVCFTNNECVCGQWPPSRNQAPSNMGQPQQQQQYSSNQPFPQQSYVSNAQPTQQYQQAPPARPPPPPANGDGDSDDGKDNNLYYTALAQHQNLYGDNRNNNAKRGSSQYGDRPSDNDQAAHLRVPVPPNCVRLYSNSPEYTCTDNKLPPAKPDYIQSSPSGPPRNQSSNNSGGPPWQGSSSSGTSSNPRWSPMAAQKRDVDGLAGAQDGMYGLMNPRPAMPRERVNVQQQQYDAPALSPEDVGQMLNDVNFNADMCYDFIRAGYTVVLPGKNASDEQYRQERTRKYLDPRTTADNVAARRDAPLTEHPTGHYRVMRPNAETRRYVSVHMIMKCIPQVLISSGKLPNNPDTLRQLANMDLRAIPVDYIQTTLNAIDALQDHTQNDHGYEVELAPRVQPRTKRQANFTFDNEKSSDNIADGDETTDDDKCMTINDFRKINGVQNNLQTPSHGTRQTPYMRLMGIRPRYKDSIHGMRNLAYRPCSPGSFATSAVECYDLNAPLPGPKDISDQYMKNPERIGGHEQQVSHMIVGWGQFLMHDITKIPADPLIDPRTGRGGSCLGRDNNGQYCVVANQDARCASVCPRGNCRWNAGSPTDCVPIVRAAVKTNALGDVTAFNEVTTFIDASNVYGSSSGEMSMLREPPPFDYVLKMAPNGLLANVQQCPALRINDCKSSPDPNHCACCGDDRCNEHPGLTSLQTTFVRYHNLIADSLFTLNGCPANPSRPNDCWNPARTYLEARKIVAATMQQITYNEWLPWILGPDLYQAFRLNDAARDSNGYEMGYQNAVEPGVYMEFAAAAGRFGHSLVRLWWGCDKPPAGNGPPCQFDPRNPTGLPPPAVVETPEKRITQFFLPAEQFRTKPYYDNQGQFQRIIESMSREQCQTADEWIDEALRSQLNGPPEMDDLAAINIQRGRDVGLGGYAEYAVWCRQHLNDIQAGLGDKYYQSPNMKFDMATQSDALHRLQPGDFPLKPETAGKLQQTYNFMPPSSWDLFPSGLSEMIVDGGLVGPTFACIIGQQMVNLKYGDRFWYANAPVNTDGQPSLTCGDNKAQAFTRCQLQKIREQANLANVLCYTKSVQAISPDPFVMPDNTQNPGRFCSTVPTDNYLDLARHWSLDAPCRGVECENC